MIAFPLTKKPLGIGGDGGAHGGAGNDVLTGKGAGPKTVSGGDENTAFLTNGAGVDSFCVNKGFAEYPNKISLTGIANFCPAVDRLVYEHQNNARFQSGDLRAISALDAGGRSTTLAICGPADDGGAEVLLRIRLIGVASFGASNR